MAFFVGLNIQPVFGCKLQERKPRLLVQLLANFTWLLSADAGRSSVLRDQDQEYLLQKFPNRFGLNWKCRLARRQGSAGKTSGPAEHFARLDARLR